MISILKANSTLPGLKWAMFMLPELHTFIRERERERERERRGAGGAQGAVQRFVQGEGREIDRQGDRETVKKEEK